MFFIVSVACCPSLAIIHLQVERNLDDTRLVVLDRLSSSMSALDGAMSSFNESVCDWSRSELGVRENIVHFTSFPMRNKRIREVMSGVSRKAAPVVGTKTRTGQNIATSNATPVEDADPWGLRKKIATTAVESQSPNKEQQERRASDMSPPRESSLSDFWLRLGTSEEMITRVTELSAPRQKICIEGTSHQSPPLSKTSISRGVSGLTDFVKTKESGGDDYLLHSQKRHRTTRVQSPKRVFSPPPRLQLSEMEPRVELHTSSLHAHSSVDLVDKSSHRNNGNKSEIVDNGLRRNSPRQTEILSTVPGNRVSTYSWGVTPSASTKHLRRMQNGGTEGFETLEAHLRTPFNDTLGPLSSHTNKGRTPSVTHEMDSRLSELVEAERNVERAHASMLEGELYALRR